MRLTGVRGIVQPGFAETSGWASSLLGSAIRDLLNFELMPMTNLADPSAIACMFLFCNDTHGHFVGQIIKG